MGNNSASANLELAFDVGHSSLGWAVLQSSLSPISHPPSPTLLGCGAVTFGADDCLASVRRGFRRQRRHIRATRLRIARLKRLLAHLRVLSPTQLDAVASSSPWLLAARVLRGGSKLTWEELWDVLRWYAHNRGYDGNKGWSRQDLTANPEDTEKEQKAHELLDAFRAKHGREGTMAEVLCDRLGLDPLAAKQSSAIRFRDLGAAFPREGVEAEVERLLRAHLGVLPGVDEAFITAVLRDHTAIVGPDYRLPARYGQRVGSQRTPGGLLFGQLVPRFDNRIIATCPVQFQRVYDRVLAETGNASKATFEAHKLAKVPGVGCVEFHRFRWAMQLANVTIATGDARKSRRLSKEERLALNADMEKHGALTPSEFKKAVRALTGTNKDNLDRLLALPDADKSLILDPARKLVASGVLGVLWPHLAPAQQQHTLTNLRRGKAITVRALLDKCPAAAAAFDHWWDGEAMKKPRKPRKGETAADRIRDQAKLAPALDTCRGTPSPPSEGGEGRGEEGRPSSAAPLSPTLSPLVPRGEREPARAVTSSAPRDQALDEAHALAPANGRAAHSREVMDEVWQFVLAGDGHPMDPGGPLFRSEAIRRAQLDRVIDEQTNNHLVRHRLKLLERLHEHLLTEFAGGDPTRVSRITIEVNRNLKELSGKTAQEQAKEQGQQTAQFRSVEKKLNAAYGGLGVKLGPGLIRKGRIAEDMGWQCPYTGATYDELDLLHRRVDKDHIVPRSQRTSDSLDSLVITFSEINKLKGQRTAVQFVEEFQSQPIPGLPNLMVKTLSNFLRDVEGLDTFKGHDDDKRRKKNRQRLLKLRDYVEKEFTPGDLTKTSQLVRLGAEALQRAYLNTNAKPVIVSLPGAVTAAARKSWNLLGCLTAANPNVLNAEDLDENGKPRLHRKTELRGITHLHHALDASTIAFTSHLLPCDGGVWKREAIELLAKRRCNTMEQAQLRALLRWNVSFTQEGQPMLAELPDELREQLRARLAEVRVVQHIPGTWGGLPTKETIWRVFDPKDQHRNARRIHRWLLQAKVQIPDPDSPKTTTVLLTMRKRRNAKDEEGGVGGKVFRDTKREWKWVYCEVERSKVLGLGVIGDKKLRKIKGGKLIDDNYGIALFPDAPKGEAKYQPIRFFRVWEEMQRLKKAGDGKRPPILRRGQLIRFKTGPFAGKTWRVLGLEDNGRVRFFEPDTVRRIDKPENYKKLQITSLMKCGLEILKPTLCGVAQASSGPTTSVG